jgi:DNA-binding IclR family transcriptional regulator
VPKISTSYLLRTLVGRGYVRSDVDTGQHTLGLRVLSLGGQAMQGMALRELAMPHLRRIVETTRLGAHLAILDHGDAVYIERIESSGFEAGGDRDDVFEDALAHVVDGFCSIDYSAGREV